MRLSKYEKIRSARERAFQRTVIATILAKTDAAPPSSTTKRLFGRTLKILNSGAFLAILGILVSFGVFYHRTYVACVDDSRKFYQDYTAVKFELFQRQADIASAVYKAKSMKDLQETLSHIKFFDRQFREDTTLDLQTRQLVQSTSIDTTGIGLNPGRTLLEQADAFQKYKSLFFYGVLDEKLSDNDLPAAKQLAVAVLEVNALSFILDLRNIGQIECVPQSVFALMWGERPITVRKYDPGSFLESERIHQRIDAQRNHLAPIRPPPSLPATNETGSIPSKP